ncbi:hypothetical protein [Paenibacillus massiliensis]|uniref:hypothetical protein n=1 Tax=Paenibacillus massiliensis TaxID=225917 RepID=UPI000378AF48|nr:hypothetical protein [Paenibacillus massiliensis]
MKKLGVFMLVLILTLGTNLLLDLLYGVRHPLGIMASIIFTLRPIEISMWIFILLCFIISLSSKRLGKAIRGAISGYLNLLRKPGVAQSSKRQRKLKGRQP